MGENYLDLLIKHAQFNHEVAFEVALLHQCASKFVIILRL